MLLIVLPRSHSGIDAGRRCSLRAALPTHLRPCPDDFQPLSPSALPIADPFRHLLELKSHRPWSFSAARRQDVTGSESVAALDEVQLEDQDNLLARHGPVQDRPGGRALVRSGASMNNIVK